MRGRRRWAGAGFLVLTLLAGRAGAQELTPRAYSPNPTGGMTSRRAWGMGCPHAAHTP
jgi:hypothetical protein